MREASHAPKSACEGLARTEEMSLFMVGCFPVTRWPPIYIVEHSTCRAIGEGTIVVLKGGHDHCMGAPHWWHGEGHQKQSADHCLMGPTR